MALPSRAVWVTDIRLALWVLLAICLARSLGTHRFPRRSPPARTATSLPRRHGVGYVCGCNLSPPIVYVQCAAGLGAWLVRCAGGGGGGDVGVHGAACSGVCLQPLSPTTARHHPLSLHHVAQPAAGALPLSHRCAASPQTLTADRRSGFWQQETSSARSHHPTIPVTHTMSARRLPCARNPSRCT
jgi:hypothetical protein